jgi:predicted NAD/FAD-binding protein
MWLIHQTACPVTAISFSQLVTGGLPAVNIAVIGAGISGLGCAYQLAKRGHRVDIFEARDRIGGHTATFDVQIGTRRFAVDTGFIVFNDRNYPNLLDLFKELGVASKDTTMGFSVCDEASGLEYAGNNLNTLFAQRGNLLSPSFLAMIREILRFNKLAIADLDAGRLAQDQTLGDYLKRHGFSAHFSRQYLLAMTSAIWSADFEDAQDFPVGFFVRFFRNHGLLSINNRPQWRVVEGGSREYLTPLTERFADNIKTRMPVSKILRPPGQPVSVHFTNGLVREFDEVVIATHSDEALAMLGDATNAEKAVLGALPYRDNEVILHTDTRLLPKTQRAWSSWNYRLKPGNGRATVTYNMNILQGLDAPETFCVTLNDTASINPHRILGRFNYAHPQFTLAGMQAQQRWDDINGQNGTWFCGAYWQNGFHEDGLSSGLRVAENLCAARQMAA